jgi:hypothetical protein
MTTTETETSTPAAEAPVEAPVEAPFSADALTQCTAKFTHKGWYLFTSLRPHVEALQSQRFRMELTARSAEGATELATLLDAAHVTAVKQEGKTLRFMATFAQLQTALKHAQAQRVHVEAI